MLPRQLALFDRGAPGFDASFARVRRIQLSDDAWLDHQVGWVTGQDALFGLPWKYEQMWMYDRVVDVPRMLARVAPDGPGQPVIEQMRAALTAQYGEEFVRTTAALYRDGNDSVAFHGDTTARDMPAALVATVSLGERRKFLLKPTEGGAARSLLLGGGDLVVMGGSSQRTWRHAVPKVARAGPRIALMFRPAWAIDYG